MRRFLILTRREILGILFNPPILFMTAFFVLLDSFAFYVSEVRADVPTATFHNAAVAMLYTSIVLFPFAVRHSFSADNANGTIELLLTAPVSRFVVVLAKYTAGMLFVVMTLLGAIVYGVLLSYGGNLDWNAVAAALLALVAVGSLAISLGVFISALTSSPAAAAAGASGILIFMALASDLDPYNGSLEDIVHSISFVPHAKRWIGGLVETQGMVYFVTITALFLFYAWLAVSHQEPERPRRNAAVRRRLTATYLLISAGFILLLLEGGLLNIGGYWETGSTLGHNLPRVPRRLLLPVALALGAFVWSFFTYRAARRAQRRYARSYGARYATISETQVLRAPRYYFGENVRSRQRSVLAALAALIVVFNLNWIAHYPFRTFDDGGRLSFLKHLQSKSWDVTHEKKNSLAPSTVRALDALQGRLQIYSFLSDATTVNEVPVATDLRTLLARYADTNALVTAVYADIKNEPELAKDLAAELDLLPDDLENSLVASYQGRYLILPAEMLAVAPDQRRRSAGDTRWVFDGETRLTQAILHLTDPRVPKVFFTYGHLEHSLSAGAAADRSISRFIRAISGVNMRARQHSFAASGPIPVDCDILVVAAPRVLFKAEEVEEISKYLEDGGKLMVFAPASDEEMNIGDDPFADLMFRIGGSFRDDSVTDNQNNDGDDADILGRIVAGNLENVRTVFPKSRSIRDNPRSRDNGWTVRHMIDSYVTARALSREDGQERVGPFTLLYRSTKPTDNGEARAAVFASGQLASNAGIGKGLNQALVLSTAQWLAGREEATDIEARRWVDRRLRLTGPQMRAMLWISLVALPLAWLFAGITAWWFRRE